MDRNLQNTIRIEELASLAQVSQSTHGILRKMLRAAGMRSVVRLKASIPALRARAIPILCPISFPVPEH